MQALFSTHTLREMEHAYRGPDSLMHRAGRAIAHWIKQRFPAGSRILMVAGPGNNGGDALTAAAMLHPRYQVQVLMPAKSNHLPPDARHALQQWKRTGQPVLEHYPSDSSFDVIVDGLFGIGLKRMVEGEHKQWIEAINQSSATVLAIDIPSGLDADSGQVLGVAVRAHATLSFLGLKPGLVTGVACNYVGELILDTLGAPAHPEHDPAAWRYAWAEVSDWLPAREPASHKGHFGMAGILGGALGMQGAALLAGRAALHLGAGRVMVGMLAPSALGYDPMQPELMLRQAADMFAETALDVLAIGPGLGTSAQALQMLDWALRAPIALVLDADALNLLAQHPAMLETLAKRRSPSIITPHPLEAARLLKTNVAQVERDRYAAARDLARDTQAVVVLKGAGTVVACGESLYVNQTINPALASGGQGDVLTGMITALLAQGLHHEDAVLMAVALHGAAADQLMAQGVGPVGLTASETLLAARACLNRSANRSSSNVPLATLSAEPHHYTGVSADPHPAAHKQHKQQERRPRPEAAGVQPAQDSASALTTQAPASPDLPDSVENVAPTAQAIEAIEADRAAPVVLETPSQTHAEAPAPTEQDNPAAPPMAEASALPAAETESATEPPSTEWLEETEARALAASAPAAVMLELAEDKRTTAPAHDAIDTEANTDAPEAASAEPQAQGEASVTDAASNEKPSNGRSKPKRYPARRSKAKAKTTEI